MIVEPRERSADSGAGNGRESKGSRNRPECKATIWPRSYSVHMHKDAGRGCYSFAPQTNNPNPTNPTDPTNPSKP